jgi:CHAT domain-containing protein
MFSALAAIALSLTPAEDSLSLPVRSPLELSQSSPELTPVDEISRLLEDGDRQAQAEDYTAAIDSYRQALAAIESQSEADPLLKLEALSGLGDAYFAAEDYDAALPVLKAALSLRDLLEASADDSAELRYGEMWTYLAQLLGVIYQERAEFGTALGYYQQGLESSLVITDATIHTKAQADLLHNIGLVESAIGQYREAEETLGQVLQLSRELEDVCLESSSIFAIGSVYERQTKYEDAIATYQSAIDLFERDESNSLEACQEPYQQARGLNNLGMAYLKQQNYAAAQEAFDRGFSLLAQKDDLLERAILLDSLGSLYQATDEPDKAWSAHLKSLRLSEQTEDVVGEIDALLNLGKIMEGQAQPDLAIFFYKQAIAQIETIRQNLRQLSALEQQSYTLTVEDFYRNLADLLLQQDRVSEAQQILELLKLQEVNSYLHDGQDDGALREETLNNRLESLLAEAFDDFTAEISLAEFIQHPAVVALTESQSTTADGTFELRSIEALQQALAAQPVKSAALYPLILGDRLEIILITADSLESYTTPVTRSALSEAVVELQTNLTSRIFDVKPAAKQLYDWLIGPLEETLSNQQIENIVYLPDGVLRYVPIAALYDGEQWFAQKYQSHNITAASIDDLSAQPDETPNVLAGAFTDDVTTYTVQGDVFNGLPAAKQEIENLKNFLPDTLALLDRDFTPEQLLQSLAGRQIVHLATHAKFVAGQPEDSFILFGDGSTVNMRDIRQWQLPDIDLVVFSACQTAMSAEGDGKEILGLGFQVQQTGAKAAVASLWSVDDAPTAALMNQFYRALSEGKTKAQALQQAQQNMIASVGFNNPTDWAAFIVIGNGL